MATNIIDKIISEFNFDRVRKVMVATNWKWISSSLTMEIPDIEHMRKTARELLEDVSSVEEWGSWSTGGFKATKDPSGRVSLEFIVEESSFPYD